MTQETIPEEKKETKKLLRVMDREMDSYGNYGSTSLCFSFVSSPENGRKQASSLVACREYVNRIVFAAAKKINDSVHRYGKDAPIDFERLRLLITYEPNVSVKEFKEKLFNGKACLNVLENLAGWKPSIITTVVHPRYKNAWMLTGPKEWMSQPQLLSLATWVIRLSSNFGPFETESFDAFESNMKRLLNTTKEESQDIKRYLHHFWDKLYILMKFHKTIWEDADLDKAWPNIDVSSLHALSGLTNFVETNPNYTTYVQEANKRFKDLCKEHLPRENPLIKRT